MSGVREVEMEAVGGAHSLRGACHARAPPLAPQTPELAQHSANILLPTTTSVGRDHLATRCSRVHLSASHGPSAWRQSRALSQQENRRFAAVSSGASRTRTGDLLGAIQALSQLSYSPARAQCS